MLHNEAAAKKYHNQQYHNQQYHNQQYRNKKYCNKIYRYIAAGTAFLLAGQLLVACGADKTENAEQDTEALQTEVVDTQQVEVGNTTEQGEENAEDLFVFTRENFPKLDGSTSLAPLATAAASVLLGESAEDVAELVDFHKTTQSYRNLMTGQCSLIFASEPNPIVFDEMEEAGFACDIEPISTEALIFVVNEKNPVDNLSGEQIRKIYSGEITNWREVGGDDLAIAPFQRNAGAGSQALMEKLVMGDTPLTEAPAAYMIADMGELMAAVKSYDNSANAIGYSVYYYANDMKMAEGLKIISVDGVVPEPRTIREGTYPYTNAYFCAIDAECEEDSPERILYNWIVSAEGQSLVAQEGYVAIMEEEDSSAASGVKVNYENYQKKGQKQNKYTRLKEDFIPDLVEGDDYGMILPFVAAQHYNSWKDLGYGYPAGVSYGIADAAGRIIADPTYTEAKQISYEDYRTDKRYYCPFWALGRTMKVQDDSEDWREGTVKYALASLDGSFVTDCKYGVLLPMGNGVLAAESYDSKKFVLYGEGGKILLTDKSIKLDGIDVSSFYNSYGEGLLRVCIGELYYYLNMEGETVLGPYTSASSFHDGFAIVTDNSGCYMINTDGEKLTEELPEDSYRDCYYGYVAVHKNDALSILDHTGKELFTVNHDGNINTFPSGLFMISNSPEDYWTGVVYDHTGRQLCTYDENWDAFTSGSGIMYRRVGDSTTLFNMLTQTTATLEGTEYYVSDIMAKQSRDGRIKSNIVFASRYDEETDEMITTYLYTDTLKPVEMELKDLEICYNGITGEKYLLNNGSRGYELMDEDLNILTTYSAEPLLVGDYRILMDQQGSEILDADGNEIFYYSLAASYDD